MSYPDLPDQVKQMQANEGHRVHHHIWHFVRSRANWESLPQENRIALINEGWEAPRFNEEPGSGIDFLGMHHEMIAMVDRALQMANDPNWPRVSGWSTIPWSEDDADWPVPEWQTSPPSWADPALWTEFTNLAMTARSSSRIAEMQRLAEQFQDPNYLTSVSLDKLGIDMEWSIHGWMHMRWSGAPYADTFSTSPSNDWLFVPWSSHVNPVFWKLHGWIDERIDDWEKANGQTADLSDAWSGPGVPGAPMPHMADVKLLERLPKREEAPLPMAIKEHVVEGLLARNERS